MSEARSVAIVGFLAAGALILGLGFCLGGREPSAGTIAPLRIQAPATGDTVANPVVITFATPAALQLDATMGWSADEMHLHAMVDSVEVMPAAADITPLADTLFAWRLPVLPRGQSRIHLTWAGRHHGNLAGVSDTIHVHVR